MFSASFRQGITTETSGVGAAVGVGAAGGAGLGDCAHRRASGSAGSGQCASATAAYNARAGGKWRASSVAHERDEMLAGCASARLRLPVPPHGRRRRALVSRTSPSASRRDGHEVTYLTLRQWDRGEQPADRRARAGRRRRARGWRSTRAAGAGASCRRSSSGSACSLHLLRHGRRYDVVHTASFPYFSLLGRRRCCGRCARYGLVVDWHEVWSRGYWREYLGGARRARRVRRPARCARACPSARSASRGCTPRGCARRGCAAR